MNWCYKPKLWPYQVMSNNKGHGNRRVYKTGLSNMMEHVTFNVGGTEPGFQKSVLWQGSRASKLFKMSRQTFGFTVFVRKWRHTFLFEWSALHHIKHCISRSHVFPMPTAQMKWWSCSTTCCGVAVRGSSIGKFFMQMAPTVHLPTVRRLGTYSNVLKASTEDESLNEEHDFLSTCVEPAVSLDLAHCGN